MRSRLLFLIAALLIIILFGPTTRPVSAHANLLRSSPDANATLDLPPAQIEMFFSEPIEPGFSSIEVLDGAGKRVDNDDSEVDLADPTRLTTSLRSLPDGIYTVSWRVLSSVDSHVTAGAFPFAVGEVNEADFEAATPADTKIQIVPGEVVARWLTYLSVMTLVGGIFFVLFVWRPASEADGLDTVAKPDWSHLALIAILTLFAANLLWLFTQAGQVSGQPVVFPWDPIMGQVLFTTRFGALWLARLALGLALLWLLPKSASGWGRWLTIATGLLLLLTISLGSHAAAQPEPFLPVLADWIHLAAASVWVGGLISFVYSLITVRRLESAERSRLTARLIPRFSALALVSVSIVVLTGLYATILQVGTLDALLNTSYGRTLYVKLILVVIMIILGAVNLFITTPEMKRAAAEGEDSGQVVGFQRLVRSEVVLGAGVLLTVGILTTLSPARIADDTPLLSGRQRADDLEISLEIVPGRPGLNTFTVEVDANRSSLNAIREVSLQFTPASGDLPPIVTELNQVSPDVYDVEGGFLALPDTWQLQVVVRRENAFDAFAIFDFPIGLPSAIEPTAVSQSFPWHRLSGAMLLASGGLILLSGGLLFSGKENAFRYGLLMGGALAAVGLFVFLDPPGEQRSQLLNPIPPNANSVAIGRELYQVNCVPCHGPTGAGDGPVGLTLNPQPADLTQHTTPGVHPDGRLYDWITNGFPNSVMPAFVDNLTDEQRWNLVNYIRTLARPAEVQ